MTPIKPTKPSYRCGCTFDISNNPPPTCPIHNSHIDESTIRCTICNQPALKNDPMRSNDGQIIICANCQSDVSDLMQGFSSKPPYKFIPRWQQGEIIIWGLDGEITNAWIKGGNRVFPVEDHERSLDIIEMVDIINDHILNNEFRCTVCGDNFDEPGHAQLFAHYICNECNRLFEENAKEEIAEGKVCSKCGKPFSKCYC